MERLRNIPSSFSNGKRYFDPSVLKMRIFGQNNSGELKFMFMLQQDGGKLNHDQ